MINGGKVDGQDWKNHNFESEQGLFRSTTLHNMLSSPLDIESFLVKFQVSTLKKRNFDF